MVHLRCCINKTLRPDIFLAISDTSKSLSNLLLNTSNSDLLVNTSKSGSIFAAFGRFFCCYHSAETPFLIDMSVPGLFKIPQVSREASPSTLGCYCHPGPSLLVARCKSGVPTVQKSQGRKWDISRKQCCTREVFVPDEHCSRL